MQKSKNSVPYDRLWNWFTCGKGKVKTSIVFHMAGVFNNSLKATHALELDDRVDRSALLHFPTPFVQISTEPLTWRHAHRILEIPHSSLTRMSSCISASSAARPSSLPSPSLDFLLPPQNSPNLHFHFHKIPCFIHLFICIYHNCNPRRENMRLIDNE